MDPDATIVLLFAVAAAIALIARACRIPEAVVLVLAGLALGANHLVAAPHLTKELLYAVFLPGLLFEAAFHLGLEQLTRNKLLILSLAFPGTLVAVALTTGLILAVPHADFGAATPWFVALVFASLISATDPITVVSLFKALGVPRRLGMIVEGESLINDGVSAILYTLAVVFSAGGEVGFAHAALDFVKIVVFGALVGAAIGLGVWKACQRLDDTSVATILTAIAAYGSFVAAEQLHASGLIATVTAGLLCGGREGLDPKRRAAWLSVGNFWIAVAFALSSLVFLLMGLEIDLGALTAAWRPILAAFVIVLLARALVVFATTAAVRRTSERIPWRWGVVLTWSGLRGALSMVLALALPDDFPGRTLVISTTFGVVVLSILINGTTSATLLRRLALSRDLVEPPSEGLNGAS